MHVTTIPPDTKPPANPSTTQDRDSAHPAQAVDPLPPPPPYAAATGSQQPTIAQPQPQRPALPLRMPIPPVSNSPEHDIPLTRIDSYSDSHLGTLLASSPSHSPGPGIMSMDPNDLRSVKRNSYLKSLVIFSIALLVLWFFYHQRSAPEDTKPKYTWGSLTKGRCVRYKTRIYSAPMMLGSKTVTGTTKCDSNAIPVTIHGKAVAPVSCEVQGPKNETYGFWEVGFEEPSCATYWSPPKDVGCTATGSGYRRFEAKLQNAEHGARWEDMCASTPVTFNRMTFKKPEHCMNRGILGMYGAWIVEDKECH